MVAIGVLMRIGKLLSLLLWDRIVVAEMVEVRRCCWVEKLGSGSMYRCSFCEEEAVAVLVLIVQ